MIFAAWRALRRPMGWALDGMHAVFLGTPTPADILPRAALLFAFALVCLACSAWLLRRPGIFA